MTSAIYFLFGIVASVFSHEASIYANDAGLYQFPTIKENATEYMWTNLANFGCDNSNIISTELFDGDSIYSYSVGLLHLDKLNISAQASISKGRLLYNSVGAIVTGIATTQSTVPLERYLSFQQGIMTDSAVVYSESDLASYNITASTIIEGNLHFGWALLNTYSTNVTIELSCVQFTVTYTLDSDSLLNRTDMVRQPMNVSSKSSSNMTIIALSVSSSIIIFGLVIVIVLFFIWRRRRSEEVKNRNIEIPYEDGNGSSTADFKMISPSSSSSRNSYSSIDNIEDEWKIEDKDLILEKQIGRGAFGVVYKGVWRTNPVAIKRIVDYNDTSAVDFERESMLMKELKYHPNVLQMYGVCISPPSLVTEFVENGSLWDHLKSSKTLSSYRQVNIIMGIARGMLHLHLHGVIHRDLAARNVLLDENLQPKISDFGFARVNTEDQGQTNNTLGPIRWMPPESLRGSTRVYGVKTDVWAFAATLMEIYTQEVPFKEFDVTQLLIALLNGEFQPEAPLQVDPQIGTLINQCFKRNATERPDFSEICNTLSQVVESTPRGSTDYSIPSTSAYSPCSTLSNDGETDYHLV